MVDIRSLSDNKIIYSTGYNEGCTWKKTLMGEDCITLRFSSDILLVFHLGDYVETEFGRYEMIDLQKPVLNGATGGYDYNLRFDAYYRKWRNKIVFYDRQGMKEASWNLTGTADKHLAVVLSNLETLGYTYQNKAFEVNIDEVVGNEAKSIQYESTNILDALTKIAEAWECEWWITDNVIHLGRCEYGDPVKLEIGEEVAEMSANDSQSSYATRIYAFGSTRNIPKSYQKECRVTITEVDEASQGEWIIRWNMPYSDVYMPDELTIVYGNDYYKADRTSINLYHISTEIPSFGEGDIVVLEGIILSKVPSEYLFSSNGHETVEGIVQRRLMLPDGIDHVDAFEEMSEEDAVEDIVIFEDIYPERIGTVANVFTHTYIDEIKGEDGSVTKREWEAYRFKDNDPNFHFSEQYIIEGQELRLKFCSGALNGMDFAVIFNPHAEGEVFQPEKNKDGSWNPLAQVFEIKRNEESGRELPAGTFVPEKGDTYVLYGFDTSMISDIYIPEAEERLLKKAREYVEKSKVDPSTYICKLASDVAAGYDPATGVSDVSKILDFDLGDSVNLVNPAYFPNGRLSRIIGFEKKLDCPYDVPVYTVGEKPAYSRIGAIEDKIAEIANKDHVSAVASGNGVYVVGKYDNTTLSDRNVLSSLRSRQESVSRLYDDIVDGTVTFNREQVFKNGIRDEALVSSGTGWHIGYDAQNNSYMEIDKLNVRRSAEFHEIVCENIKHVEGALILSLASITVSKVIPIKSASGNVTEFRCEFDLGDPDENGQYPVKNNFVAEDKALCQIFSGSRTKYYWMLVTSVGQNYIVLSNTEKDKSSDFVPEIGDYIVQCGNKKYSSRQNVLMLKSYDTPSIVQYQGVGVGSEFSFQGKDVTVLSPEGNKFTGSFISKVSGNLETSISNLNALIGTTREELQSQIDGQIINYFEEYDPLMSNLPAAGWTTEVDKDRHLNDTFTNVGTGASWKFVKSQGYYYWESIEDTATQKALELAAEARNTADKKRRIFTSRPVPPYDPGDLWVNATIGSYSNSILKCVIKRIAGQTFSDSHWTKADGYADKTYVESKITQTNENITLAVKGIEIGGRNLFLDSANRGCVNNPTWYFQTDEENPPFPFRITEMTGKNIVVSFDCEASNIPEYTGFQIGVQIFAIYANGDSLVCHASVPYSLFSNGYYKGRFSYPVYIPEGELKPIDSAAEFLATVNYLNGQTGLDGINPVFVKIGNIKVEFGNKPTDWTPAPEDKAGTVQLKEAGIDIKAGTVTLSASDKTKVEAILPNGSKVDVAVFEIRNNKPVLRADIISGDVIANVIKTNTLNVNNNTIIDKNGILTSKNGIFENVNAKSGIIGPFVISNDNLTASYSEHEDPNDYNTPVIRTYHTALAGQGISFVNMEALGMVSVNAGINMGGTGRTFLEVIAEPDNMNPLINGISLDLKETNGFNGIYCKVQKNGGYGVAKGIVIDTANPKDDVALEATGRVRFYNVRDVANENAVYNLQLYAQNAGNGNFYLMAKPV